MLRLLLKDMQHIHGFLQFHRVDGSEGIASVIGYNFQYPSCTTLQRLGIDMLFAHLCLIESKPNMPLHSLRKLPQNPVRVGNEDQLLHA